MKSKNPKVSVIIPTYNREYLLSYAIYSVLNQTFQDFELIVIDDGSVDKTKKVVEEFQKKDNRISYFYQKNKGSSSARNLGIKKSKGEYIAFLDSDDRWLPEKLEKQLTLFEKAKENIGIVSCSAIDYSNERELKEHSFDKLKKEEYFPKILDKCFIHSPSSVVIKKKVIKDVGYFDEKLETCQDWEMWIRILEKYELDFVFSPLFKYYVHSFNISKKRTKKRDLEILKYVLNKHKEKYDRNPLIKSKALRKIANCYISVGDRLEAIKYFIRSIKCNPLYLRSYIDLIIVSFLGIKVYKLTGKTKNRAIFLKKIIKEKKIKFFDFFYFFLPNNSLEEKKKLEEIIGIIKNYYEEDVIIKMNSLTFRTFFFKHWKIFPSYQLRREVLTYILDFGIPIINKKKEPFLFDEGPYEMEKCCLKRGDFVIDAGANIGIFSLFASSVIGKEGQIFSFEPVKKTRDSCIKNLEINNIKNCKVISYALGNTNKKVDIFFNNDILSSSSVFKKDYLKKKEKVIQIKLDDFVKENDIKRIDFIKIDIKGAERCLLRGGRETIKRFKPKIAVCIYHFESDRRVIEKLLKETVPEYKIIHGHKKLYAYI